MPQKHQFSKPPKIYFKQNCKISKFYQTNTPETIFESEFPKILDKLVHMRKEDSETTPLRINVAVFVEEIENLYTELLSSSSTEGRIILNKALPD